jgi:hypothetical protein
VLGVAKRPRFRDRLVRIAFIRRGVIITSAARYHGIFDRQPPAAFAAKEVEMRSPWILASLVCLSLTAGSVRGAGPASAPAVVQDAWTGVERVVAVGDVHGDCDQFVKALRAAGVVDDKTDWIGGKAHLVQVGDVLDRGPDSRKAMDLLMKLEGQAAKAGGAVHALLGNHEAMAMLGDHRYTTPEELDSFGGFEEFRKAVGPEGRYGRWLRGHNTVIRINDVLYLHGGLSAAYAAKSLAEINAAVRQNLAAGGKKGIAMDSGGPLWYRGLANERAGEAKVAAELGLVLSRQGAARMVVGHTVSEKGIQIRADGRLIMIDVGMTRFYGGPAACLVIEKDDYFKVSPGKKEKIEIPAAKGRKAA